MTQMRIAVACRNASGMPDMPIFTVATNDHEIVDGTHYDKAEALAHEAGYEGPYICFDTDEHNAILAAVRTLDLVPQVVVIDMSDGLVHSIRCDTGEIKVICYDESDTDEFSEAVAEHPVGEDGQPVRCWTHMQIAEVDPGLAKARG
jgi:hypothetical protein